MILDVSDALGDWVRPVTIKNVTTATVNFEPVETVTPRTVQAVVQVARPDELMKRGLDTTVEHIMYHSTANVLMKELIEFNGKDYRVIQRSAWNGYGYVEAVAAETKEPLR
jgi:hypothetical protein